jgi:hypothetical protein
MDDARLAQIELKQKQLFDRLNNVEKNTKPKKDIWDIMSAATPLISGILISGIGLYFAYSNNEAQLKLQETQTIERFFPHLNGTEQEKKAAILAISSLTNTETAAKYAELFPSEGTASALKTIASSGSVQPHDKDVANKALVSTFHKMADDYQATQNTTQAAQAYQQSIDAQANIVGADSPELINNLAQLVEAYKADHKYPLAENTLRRILKIEKDSSGSRSPQFIDTLNKLATVLKLEGKNDAADHASDYANLLAQQKASDAVQTTTSTVSAPTDSTTIDANQDQPPTANGSDIIPSDTVSKIDTDLSNKHSATEPIPTSTSVPPSPKDTNTLSTANSSQKSTL